MLVCWGSIMHQKVLEKFQELMLLGLLQVCNKVQLTMYVQLAMYVCTRQQCVAVLCERMLTSA